MVLPADAHSADPLLTTTPADDDEDHTRRGRLSYHSSSQTTSASNSTTPSPGALRPHLGASSSTFTPSTSNPKPRPSSPLSPGPASATHRPHLSRRGTATSTTTIMMRSRSPALAAAAAARAEASRKYTYAAIFLVISLVSFTVQTMLASQIQHDLGWDKAYCMMYLTHGSWVCLWPLQLAVLRYQQRSRGGSGNGSGNRSGEAGGSGSDGGGSWKRFMDNHVRVLRGIALVVETRDVRAAARMGGYQRHGHGHHHGSAGLLEYGHSPWPYLAKATAVITSALTVAGLSWYLAVSMTTPSDLTAIYNCSAFFAYAFSVPLLKERVRADKMLAVAVAIVGVLIVAYGDSGDSGSTSGSESEAQLQAPSDSDPGNNTPALDAGTRFAGNLIIGVGSVLYGLYEVLYKRYACPPDGMDATKGVIFANTFGSLMGAFTLLVLWIPLPILHVLGWETFEIPTGYTAWLLFVSVLMNMSFSGSFLVLISLTSPVLSSVASLLTIFMVALVDWFLTGTPVSGAALFGGLLIVTAFVMLSWSTWREMNEEERRKQVDLDSSGEED